MYEWDKVRKIMKERERASDRASERARKREREREEWMKEKEIKVIYIQCTITWCGIKKRKSLLTDNQKEMHCTCMEIYLHKQDCNIFVANLL